MNLKILAISDTHLGEDSSLLSFPHGRQHLWQELRKHFGEGDTEKAKFSDDGKFSIEELIMVGDIPDRTLSSTSQIITYTNDFMRMLGSVANITKGVYIPGNHDHTMWSDYIGNRDTITGPYGIDIVEKGECKDNSAANLLTTFFGYPFGSFWREIEKRKDEFVFKIANPLYVSQFQKRTYVFAHGTHFRWDVTMPKLLKKILDIAGFDELLGKIEVNTSGDLEGASNLGDLENAVTPFVDTLWPSSKSNPTSRSDQLWYLLTTISGKFKKHRPIPSSSNKYSLTQLQTPKPEIMLLTPEDKSIKRCEKFFFKKMMDYLNNYDDISKDNITFVYGDTHDGGYGEIHSDSARKDFRVYNCGGWVVHNKDSHPPCHIFAVDTNGEEYLLDVSFNGVVVDDKTLIDLAAEDVENRDRNTSQMVKALLKVIDLLNIHDI